MTTHLDPALKVEVAHYERRRGRIAGPEKRLIAQPEPLDDAEAARILALSDDEVIAECIVAGFDPAAEAARVRKLIDDTIQEAREEEARRAGERVNDAYCRAVTP